MEQQSAAVAEGAPDSFWDAEALWYSDLERMPSEVRELRRTCIHEAAHAAVARYVGLRARWWVVPNPTTAPNELKLWIGETEVVGNAPRQFERWIALAGVIATALYENPHISTCEIFEALEWGDIPLSDSDAAGARGYSRRTVDQCLSLLLRLMPSILLEATYRQHDLRLARESLD